MRRSDTPGMSDNRSTLPTGRDSAAQDADPGDPAPDLMTVAEVAAMLRVSKMTIYRMVESGHLPAMRIGRAFRVPRASVARFLRDAGTGNAVN